MRYVKVCPNPNCRYENDQSAAACANCGELLGAIRPTRAEEAETTHSPEPPPPPAPDQAAADRGNEAPSVGPRQSGPVAKTKGIGFDMLTLEFIRGGQVFNVRDDQVLGRDDGSDDPGRVNIPADAGVDVGYVSRWHCQFHCRDGQWTVTPLDPSRYPGSLTKANPTFLGARQLAVSQSYPINDGDRLTLADVELRIRTY